MIVFDWADFTAPLDSATLSMCVILGVFLGVLVSRYGGHPRPIFHVFWTITTGMVFYIPLALIRALEGSLVWERFLATAILWVLFCIGLGVGEQIVRRENG